MSLNSTHQSVRVHIWLFGRRNSGKSSVIFNNKLSTVQEACECHKSLEESVESIWLKVYYSCGDNIKWRRI